MASISELLRVAIRETEYRDECAEAVNHAESNRIMAETGRQYAVQDLINAVVKNDALPIIVCHDGNYYEVYRDANVVPHIRRVNIVNI